MIADLPEDFFSGFDRCQPQIFVVDDAFGRTEYDVTAGRRWERDLSKILCHIDDSHWILLTTRGHILTRALKDLDLEGRARAFPQPAKLSVIADDLSVEEKALILYRHARSAGLSLNCRQILRVNARMIVEHKNFTPERIRRLVTERLPELESQSSGLTLSDVYSAISEEIRNPTLRMQRAFRTLPDRHRLLLIALLGCDRHSSLQSLRSSLQRLHAPMSGPEFFETAEELLSAFLKLRHTKDLRELQWSDSVDWIHPSYRDLVIAELSRNLSMQRRFLRTASIEGLTLALSAAGGPTGRRRFPLLTAPECWADLRERALEIACKPKDAQQLLETLISIHELERSSTDIRRKVADLLAGVCTEAEEGWPVAGSTQTTIEALLTYKRACTILGRQPRFSTIENVWRMYSHDLYITLDRSFDDMELVESWFKTVKLIENDIPDIFSSRKWQSDYGDDLAYLVKVGRSLLEEHSEKPDSAALGLFAAESLSSWLRDLPSAGSIRSSELLELAEQCDAYLTRIDDERSRSGRTPEVPSVRKNKESFDFEALFSDLGE